MSEEQELIEIDVDIITSNPRVMILSNIKGRQVTLNTTIAEVLHEGDTDYETLTTPGRVELPEWLAIKLELV